MDFDLRNRRRARANSLDTAAGMVGNGEELRSLFVGRGALTGPAALFLAVLLEILLGARTSRAFAPWIAFSSLIRLAVLAHRHWPAAAMLPDIAIMAQTPILSKTRET